MVISDDRKPIASAERAVTVERIERALDLLAEYIVKKGDEGWKWVPIYKKLDDELTRLKTLEDDMKVIRERARRSKAKRSRQ